MSPEPFRKLTAVLIADIQGYTSLMQKDAKHASSLLKRFHQIIELKVNSNNGKIENFYAEGAYKNPSFSFIMKKQLLFNKGYYDHYF